jgi:hypothetical protein
MEMNTANKCFEKGKGIDTIEEYLMVFLSMLLVKGFYQLSSNISAFERYNFDLEVNPEDSTNLETIMEMYQFDLFECLDEYVQIRSNTGYEAQKKESPRNEDSDIKEAKEDEFPDFDDKKSEEEDYSTPNFNNLYYNQHTKDFKSKETYGRTESGITRDFVTKDTFGRTDSGFHKSESAIRSNNQTSRFKNNNEVLVKIENILKSKMVSDEKGISPF